MNARHLHNMLTVCVRACVLTENCWTMKATNLHRRRSPDIELSLVVWCSPRVNVTLQCYVSLAC